MKYLAWVLAVVALIYIWADYRFVTDAVTNGLSYFFGRLDADSLKDRPLEPFALPSGHCKASFPGSPHTALPGRELLSTFSYPGTCCVMSDREVTYYLSEMAMPNRFPEFTAVAKPQSVITTIRGGASSLPVTNEPVLNTTADQTDEVKAQKAIDQIVNDWAKANTAS